MVVGRYGIYLTKHVFPHAGGYGYDTRLYLRGEGWSGSSITGCSLNMLWIL